MLMAKMEVLHLTPSERGELESYLRKRNLPASVAQRMRIVLLLDEGASYREIEEQLGAFPSTISRWKQRYEKDGVLGLATIHPGQPPPSRLQLEQVEEETHGRNGCFRACHRWHLCRASSHAIARAIRGLQAQVVQEPSRA